MKKSFWAPSPKRSRSILNSISSSSTRTTFSVSRESQTQRTCCTRSAWSLSGVSSSASSEALRNKAKQLKVKTKNVEFVRVRDKIAFVLGVMNLGITAFLTGGYPLLAPLWYTFKAAALITARFILYRRNKWHFFLADFCYFANFLLLAYVWFFPSNAKLFHVCFAFATGPLSWAVVLWSNSMVFHSIDKMTSVFIHVSPPLLVWVMRWKQRDPVFAIAECADCTPSFFDLSLLYAHRAFILTHAARLCRICSGSCFTRSSSST